MQVDFEYLGKLADRFHKDYLCDGGYQAYVEGRHVFTIEFNPEINNVRVHMAWPMFRDLVSKYARVPVTCSQSAGSLYLECTILNVRCVACMFADDLKAEFDLLGLSNEDCPGSCEDDILNLFTLWQNITGWNLRR